MSVLIKNVAGIDFGRDVGELGACTVGNDGVGEVLELVEVVDHSAAEEGRAVFERRFVDDNGSTFGLDAFHDTLN